jgi:hypothetical protein
MYTAVRCIREIRKVFPSVNGLDGVKKIKQSAGNPQLYKTRESIQFSVRKLLYDSESIEQSLIFDYIMIEQRAQCFYFST